MCGRYVLPDDEAMGEYWAISCRFLFQGIRIRYNVAPTCPVPILVRSARGGVEPQVARWGLVPRWWNKDKPPATAFNARAEDVEEKPMWKESFRSMRCLMPARGWYEWVGGGSAAGGEARQPYFLHCEQLPVMAFAGIASIWRGPGSEPVVSCAVLTKAAAAGIAGLHSRMPVVLRPEDHGAWLDPDCRVEALRGMMAGARGDFAVRAVGLRVNNIRNDGPELMEEVPTTPSLGGGAPWGGGGG